MKTKGVSKMSVSQATKAAQRCALIWFSISSAEVFEALMMGDMEPIGRLGLRIDPEAFRDICNLLKEKPELKQGIETTRKLWLIQCSPPPCRFSTAGYQSVLRQLEEGIGPGRTAE